MEKSKKPLGIVANVVEKMDLKITYVYDDLAFVEHIF